MGENALYHGHTIKIGTCEDMYYLRPDQIDLVESPSLTDITDLRFRFPFPDEDDREPGDFDDYDRGLAVPGFQIPSGISHYHVQFTARAGIRLSLPCPHSDEGTSSTLEYQFNGPASPARIVQQRIWAGVWATVLACVPCNAPFRLPDLDAARPLLAALNRELARRPPGRRRQPGQLLARCRRSS